MSKLTISDIIAQTEAICKKAEAKMAQLTGEDPADMPGAENDKPAPAEATQPDPQVADGTMGPDSARTTEGAGDDRPITAGSLFEADEPVLEPEKKPEESADADAKVASADIANDILSLIRGAQLSKKAELAQTEDKIPEDAQTEKLEADESAEEPKKVPEEDENAEADTPDEEAKEAACGKCKGAKKAKKTTSCKKAEGIDLELTTDVMAKIAAMMLATDEGADLAEKVLAKQAGVEAANETMSFLAKQAQVADELASEQQGAADAEAMIDAAAEQQGAADAEAMLDAAAEQQGAADAEEDLEAATEGDFTAEEVIEAVKELSDSGEISEDEASAILSELVPVEDVAEGVEPAEEAATEDVTVEDLAEGIQEMMDSGELSEEEVQSLITELSAEADPEVVQELASEVGEAEVPAEVPAEEPAKEASANRAYAKRAAANRILAALSLLAK